MLNKMQADRITAMKNKDTVKKNLLTLLLNRIQTIEKNKGTINDEDVLVALKAEEKQINESLRDAKKAKREDIISLEEEKLLIVNSYLPKMLSEDEILKILNDNGAQKGMNMGALMQLVLRDHKSEVRGQDVNNVIKKHFM